MTDQLNKKVRFLKDLHNSCNPQQLLDLHTHFYWLDLEVCPFCNEWLVMRMKPELIP